MTDLPGTNRLLSWLLEGDVSLVWQTKRYMTGTDCTTLDSLRRRIADEGWGACLLSERHPDGHWGRGYYVPKWTCTHYVLLELKGIGVHPEHEACRESAALLLGAKEGSDGGINYAKTVPESDVCINGMILDLASYFRLDHPRIPSLVDYLLRVRMPDGGWNCLYPKGAVHSSMHTTLSVLEGFSGYLRNGYDYRFDEVRNAVLDGSEFLLEHRLFRSSRTGEVMDPGFLRFCYPTRWRYDVLRALEFFCELGYPWDPRMGDALEAVLERRRSDGTWPLHAGNPGAVYFRMEESGKPSRWNTLRALRVLEYAGCSVLAPRST